MAVVTSLRGARHEMHTQVALHEGWQAFDDVLKSLALLFCLYRASYPPMNLVDNGIVLSLSEDGVCCWGY